MIQSTELSVDHFYSKKVGELHYRNLQICPESTPVFQAAQIMAQGKISCLFIGKPPEEVIGFVTDITLRDKVLAKQLSPNTPIGEIMDEGIVYIQKNAFLYEALLLMFQTKTRYLLVKEGSAFVGWISRTKILTEQSQSPFIFIQSVKQAIDDEELKEKWLQVPFIVHDLVSRGLKADIINQIITTIADTITLRVIENTIAKVGPPPAKFIFFVLGSEGRKEQTLKTDQDNAIIYEDCAKEQREIVRAYFLEFADQVSTALDTIGFSFCEGGFMAKNPKWTHSLSHWKKNYESWITESSQETVSKYATFFDCRSVYGDFSLLEDLKAFMDQQLQDPSERFYSNMGTNALQYEPPLTFFKNIRTFKIEGEKFFNIKKTMTPIVDLVRIISLKNRIFETNTGTRIMTLAEKKLFSLKEAHELHHAY